MSGDAIDLIAELERVIDAFAADRVPYALCGGLALAIHGHPRATKDIDLLIPPGSISDALSAAARAGFTLRAGPIPLGVKTATPQTLHRATKVASGSHVTTDLLEVSESYRPAWEGRQVVEWRGRQLSLVSKAGLVAMKRLSTRAKDLADVEALEGPNDE